MLRENKRKLFLSSAVILLPVLFGLIVWNRLPGTLITHWGA
ncbi:MAG TPA: hemolysin expression modulating protein, partial [Clostridiales bacterium]|nr:hemolysin expression modulating protein [Clostridiales bacterium]